MILDIYKDALEYASIDGESLIKLGVISFLNFLIIPIFLQLGYSYRTCKIAVNGMINGDDKLANFSDLISMFVDGLKVFTLKFIYIILPVTIGLILIMAGSDYGGVVGGFIIFLGVIISIILGAIGAFISTIAISHMAANGDSLKEAFNIKELFTIAESIGYLRVIGFYIGLIMIMFAIALIVLIILITVFSIFGITTSFISPFVGSSILTTGFIIMELIFSLIVFPFLTIFEARSIGLLYSLR